MNWTMLAASLAAVLALAWAARVLGLGGIVLADEAAARAEAEALVPGFSADEVALLPDGTAEVTGSDGRRLRLRPHGARVVAEPLP